jgi:transposase
MQQHIGIDVSKTYLDVYTYPQGSIRRVSNQRQSICALADSLRGSASVVMEATGGYERLLFTRLRQAGIPAAVVNARHIRNFARATGRLAKTDKLDAAIIAHYAATLGTPMRETMPDYSLKDMVTRRRQLVDLLVQEKNRLEKAEDIFLRRQINEHLAFLKQQLQDVDRTISGHIKADREQSGRFGILTSVPGVGEVTASILLADMPELGALTERQVAALAGVAPLNNDSGQMRGQRHIWGGRISVRCALYMATICAIRHNPAIKTYYQRLRTNGKPAKVAITASMRKLLIILNALLKQNRKWQA